MATKDAKATASEEAAEQQFFSTQVKKGNTMAKKHEGDLTPGEITESKTRPATFVPDPSDPSKARQVGPQAVDLTEFEGEFYKQDEPKDSPPYARKMVPDDPYGYTVHMKNQDHYWSGTPEQAKAQFDKTPPEPDSPEHKSEPAAV